MSVRMCEATRQPTIMREKTSVTGIDVGEARPRRNIGQVASPRAGSEPSPLKAPSDQVGVSGPHRMDLVVLVFLPRRRPSMPAAAFTEMGHLVPNALVAGPLGRPPELADSIDAVVGLRDRHAASGATSPSRAARAESGRDLAAERSGCRRSAGFPCRWASTPSPAPPCSRRSTKPTITSMGGSSSAPARMPRPAARSRWPRLRGSLFSRRVLLPASSPLFAVPPRAVRRRPGGYLGLTQLRTDSACTPSFSATLVESAVGAIPCSAPRDNASPPPAPSAQVGYLLWVARLAPSFSPRDRASINSQDGSPLVWISPQCGPKEECAHQHRIRGRVLGQAL